LAASESARRALVDATEFVRWREAAELARRGAKVQAGAQLHNWACFLAEQAAQLAIKALLHGIGAGAWGHDLVHLADTLATATGEAVPTEITAAARRLSRHYIPARYPDAHPSGTPGAHYGPEDSAEALADLNFMLLFVDDLWRRLEDASGGNER
jgi:HEPN domain-containing protein